MDFEGKRDHMRQFPIRKIEKLIQLADKYQATITVGDVTIVPGRYTNLQTMAPLSNGKPKFIEETERKVGRMLSPEEQNDEILFGPGGSIRVKKEADNGLD